jgi:hypothetical protein
MTYHARFRGNGSDLENFRPEPATRSTGRLALLKAHLSSIRRWIADWIDAAAEYYTAALIYEQLSRLSDAELKRGGLSRETLARDICEIRDAAARRGNDLHADQA